MNLSILVLSSTMVLGADQPAAAPAAMPAAPAVAAPVVVSGTSGCGGCGTASVGSSVGVYHTMPTHSIACDPCGPRLGLFARLRARLSSLRPTNFHACAPVVSCNACATAVSTVATYTPASAPCCSAPVTGCSAPVVAMPVFTGFTTACADPCERTGLLARLRARFAGLRTCDATAAPLCGASWSSSTASFAGVPVSGCTATLGTVGTAPAATTPEAMPSTPKEEPKKEEPKKEEPGKVASFDLPKVPSLGGTTGGY